MSGRRAIIGLASALSLCWVPGVQAQESEPGEQAGEEILEACSATEHRQFDFWAGEWEVTDSSGRMVGNNTIERVANGCALVEHWRGINGRSGVSLNWYEPGTGEWNQTWVGLGLYLRLSGGLENGKMVLSGEREADAGRVTDRIVWTPLEDGRVRQLWQVSRDGAAGWETVFEGTYSRSGY